MVTSTVLPTMVGEDKRVRVGAVQIPAGRQAAELAPHDVGNA